MSQITNEGMGVIYLTEKHDEAQIVSQMKGEVVSQWVYHFNQGGKEITSLSYAGVKEAVRRRGNINWKPCDCCRRPVHIEETQDEIRATVTAWDLINNVQFIGASTARKNQPFAFVIAVNKAERNAMRKFLPEKAIALLVQEFLNKEKIQPLKTSP